jgi:succinyldiaminopimelate transaminase
MTTVAATETAYFTLALDQAKEDLARRGVEIFDFGVGDPIEPTPEFIRQALIQALDPVSQYPTIVGQSRLREAIAGWARRRLNVWLDPDTQILPAAGSKEAIFHLPLAVLGPDERRRIVYPTPSYPVYEGSARYAHAIPHPVRLRPENGFRLDLAELPERVLEDTRIAWINYPHNPTGAGVDLTYLRAQVAIAQEHDILLCSDDCYLDLYFDEEETPPGILQVTQTGVLSFGSLSKRSGMTGYRSGYIAGDANVIGALKRARPSMGVGSPDFVQAAATVAWSDDRHVAERRAIFRAKYARLVSFLKRRGYRVTDSQGAIYVWVEVPAGRTEKKSFQALLEKGIVVSPGESFGAGGEGYFRLALVPSLEQIERAIAVWETIPC